MTKRISEAEQRAAIVDELGDLEILLAPYKPHEKRAKALRDAVRGWAVSQPGETAVSYAGHRHVAQVSACSIQRKPIIAKLYQWFGKAKFLSLCTIAVKTIDEHIPVAEQEHLLTLEQTGPRIVSVAPALASAKAA